MLTYKQKRKQYPRRAETICKLTANAAMEKISYCKKKAAEIDLTSLCTFSEMWLTQHKYQVNLICKILKLQSPNISYMYVIYFELLVMEIVLKS